ncbi:ATP-dependent Clp protease proteolytic subunit [Pantoea stewartii]|uniref:ATP-dependent Clp protease proteolytic subunit n=1 Tax=Pantoea stewartii TaxID=66269 RepID=UPI002DBED2F3|nr:ATP-dependent Clp protease proteolytic subunit [Pantoea stewartii]MEB6532993.1 ATP-dependent Clp protease proteolytic subunit [Pantoea stewartii]
MKYIFCAAAVFVLTSFTSQAAMNKVVDEKRPPNTVKTVKIAFTGAITQNKIMALSAAIDEIAQNYKAATEIQLYLTSPGGDVDAGKMGYQIVKDSPIPVTTVNMSSVESSATLIYCGAKETANHGRFDFFITCAHDS